MNYVRTIIGTAVAGIFVMSVWGAFVQKYDLVGGWFAAFIIIGTLWFLNHHVGMIDNQEGGAWIDMALGIGVAGTMRDIFIAGSITPLVESLPTLILVILGGITGGIVAAVCQKSMVKNEQEGV
ncbi:MULTISPECIES: Lin0368 family putative glycerol transporter subunit [Pelosinus]|uniref:Uncharacterized protein n=1 Tax=Pelosinus fermentans B4 TaxID=1149862 RepID=I8RLG0_9FIRM|nr:MULTISPECIES: hypothetical protein [Pelosinus]EIW19425.1 hypothetical protein FB4_2839 [Pelosinus fermentans B4]EIW24843.1 hypothetical protein FA11_3000 [Pelosinus fermentans A11]OAM96109.1 hypothetical protein FR7_04131 [Pelosinus fermentans DSM 17108]SDR36448.1 hypothetical protein SAMN04515679_4301 [Pelosinus fermentans]